MNDRAGDIWEPLLVLADIAGGPWPELARQAAQHLSAAAARSSPITSLLLDILLQFGAIATDRIFSWQLLEGLNNAVDRPWSATRGGGRAVNEFWLAQQLRPYGIRPRTIRRGDATAKGYLWDDFIETFRRYIPRSEIDAVLKPEAEPEAEVQKST